MAKIGEGLLDKPEDVCFDGEGILYTATRDGWIKRLHRNGSWEDWRLIGGGSLIGVTPTRTGGIIVCDIEKVRLQPKHVKAQENGHSIMMKTDCHQLGSPYGLNSLL